MIFSDVRVKDIFSVLYFTPRTAKFASKNRTRHIIGIQLTGTADHFFADRKFTVSENCIYFFNQNEDYNVEIHEKGIAFSIHFTTFAPINAKSFSIKIKDNSSVLRILNSMEQQLKRTGECTVKTLGQLYKLLSIFEDIYAKEYSAQNPKIASAKEYMNLHFKEKNCIEKAAQIYGVTPRRFNDIFKIHYHTTPNQYIINYKINLAKKLLEAEELSISDIANLCGFDDVYYFSKTFRKVTGQTARDFRKQL